MGEVEHLALALLDTVATGTRKLDRFLEGIPKMQVMAEVAKFRALEDPNATLLKVYRFARQNPREMIKIANTPVTADEIADSKWHFFPEFPTSAIVGRTERIALSALDARLEARRARRAS